MLVRKLAEMHGGSASLRGEGPGEGKRVRRPAAGRPRLAGAGRRARRRPGPAAAAGERILIVDDNVDAARGMARLLQLAGHDVRVAHDGRQALEIARGQRPRFILLDIVLPGMDGYEVARQLRGDPRHRDATIIAISGYSAGRLPPPPGDAGSTITWSSPSTTTPCGPSSTSPMERRVESRPPRRPGGVRWFADSRAHRAQGRVGSVAASLVYSVPRSSNQTLPGP